MNSVVSHNCGD